MITIFKRIGLFLVPFTVAFWFIHEQFETTISRASQNGLTGFYSSDGLIFGLIVAFVIQREWENWNSLAEAVRQEIDTVREMWKWSAYMEKPLCHKTHMHLEMYLSLIVAEWNNGKEGNRSEKVDKELDGIRDTLMSLSASGSDLNRHLNSAFVNLTQARNRRLNFSNEHMPVILKRIVMFADMLLILLSLFIAVNNLALDFLFTSSIGLLAFTLLLVIDDLDNPFRPGAWHLTTEGYESLLTELKILEQ